MELNRFKQLLESTLGDVKPLITEMNSEDLQSMFETMIDEIGEYVIENSYFGSLTEDDMESFASSMPVSLNYQWTLSGGKATRIGDVVDYSDKMDYETLQSFPPSNLIADKKTRKLYEKFLSSNQ